MAIDMEASYRQCTPPACSQQEGGGGGGLSTAYDFSAQPAGDGRETHLDKSPGLYPVGIRETLRQALVELVMRAAGDQLKTSC